MAGLNKNTIIVRVLDDLLAHAKTSKERQNDDSDGLLNAYYQSLDMAIHLKKELMERDSCESNRVIQLFPPHYPAA